MGNFRFSLKDIKKYSGIIPNVPNRIEILFTKDLNLLYVTNPKCACSTIKNIVFFHQNGYQYMEGLIHSSTNAFVAGFNKRYPNVSSINSEPSLFKFTFVRNPVSRVISGYLDKIYSDRAKDFAKYRDVVVCDYGFDRTSADAIENGFRAFLRYIAEETRARGAEKLNPHWRPQYINVIPDKIEYDLIGRVEHMEKDVAVLLDKIGASKALRDFARNEFHGSPEKKVDKNRFLTKENLSVIKDVYEKDFEVLGYELPKL